MKRVLIPTNIDQFYQELSSAYKHHGYESVVGLGNFFTCGGHYDLLHVLWPEEFSNWKPPTEKELIKIKETLKWWSHQSSIICFVNNLYPHGMEGNSAFKQLYEIFYEHSTLIVHHSQASFDLVNKEFPVTIKRPSIVTKYFNYDRLLPEKQDRLASRNYFGFSSTDFVVLCFGSLRLWEEIILIQKAFSKCSIPNKKLLMAGRYVQFGSVWRQRFRRCRWANWLKRINAVVVNEFIQDEDVYQYFEASDVVIIPRIKDLSSGLVGLAMTFAKVVIAPSHGSFPDYLDGTENPLYVSGDPDSLAQSLEKVTTMNYIEIGLHNRKIADDLTWNSIIQDCLNYFAQQSFRDYLK